MRRAANIDQNQKRIVEVARKIGASVCFLHQLGRGVPDLLLGWKGENVLVEVKNKENKNAKLNELQRDFFSSWRGSVFVVENEEQLIALLNAIACIKENHDRIDRRHSRQAVRRTTPRE